MGCLFSTMLPAVRRRTTQDWSDWTASASSQHQCNAVAAASNDSVVLACSTFGDDIGDDDNPLTLGQSDFAAVMLVSNCLGCRIRQYTTRRIPHLVCELSPFFPSSRARPSATTACCNRAVNLTRTLVGTPWPRSMLGVYYLINSSFTPVFVGEIASPPGNTR